MSKAEQMEWTSRMLILGREGSQHACLSENCGFLLQKQSHDDRLISRTHAYCCRSGLLRQQDAREYIAPSKVWTNIVLESHLVKKIYYNPT